MVAVVAARWRRCEAAGAGGGARTRRATRPSHDARYSGALARERRESPAHAVREVLELIDRVTMLGTVEHWRVRDVSHQLTLLERF